jgi:AcrR family transcriptional regulator
MTHDSLERPTVDRETATAARTGAGRRKVPRSVREAEMLQVAGRLFGRRGYNAVSMDEIAQAAGVSKPMVYAYFESKEGLFLACVERATEHLMKTLEEVTPPTLPPDVRLWRGLLAVFTFIGEHRDAWALLYPHGPHGGGLFAAGAARASEAMAGLLTRLIREAAEGEEVDRRLAEESSEPIAHALVAAVVGLASWWLRHPEEPKELQALRVMNFAWMGLGDIMRGKLWVPPPGP